MTMIEGSLTLCSPFRHRGDRRDHQAGNRSVETSKCHVAGELTRFFRARSGVRRPLSVIDRRCYEQVEARCDRCSAGSFPLRRIVATDLPRPVPKSRCSGLLCDQSCSNPSCSSSLASRCRARVSRISTAAADVALMSRRFFVRTSSAHIAKSAPRGPLLSVSVMLPGSALVAL